MDGSSSLWRAPCVRSALSLRHSAAPSLEHLLGNAADVRAVAGIQPALQHLRGCLESPAIWIATSVCLPHMWPTARSCAGTPPWTKTTNCSGTSGPSTCTRSSMNGFSSWLTSLCSSSHSLETRSVSYEAWRPACVITTAKNTHSGQLFFLVITM